MKAKNSRKGNANSDPLDLSGDSSATTDSERPIAWSGPVRAILSCLLILHLLALVAEPLRMFSTSNVRPEAPDTGLLRTLLAPYVEFTYLDHGYFFFAPNPGPNHLVECQIQPTSDSNQESIWYRFPDLSIHRPRLLYHRHFMLSEFYNTISVPTDPPPEVTRDEGLQARWRSDLARYRSIQDSMTRHLQSIYPESRVQLRRIEHQLPSDFQVLREGWKLDDPRLYQTLPETIASQESTSPAPNGSSSMVPSPSSSPSTSTSPLTPGEVLLTRPGSEGN